MSADANPLLQPWTAPFGLPPFDRIRAEHFEPAFDVALAAHLAEIEAIAADPAAPSFDNTVAAFDRSGALKGRIERVYSNLASSETSPALQVVELRLAPRLAAHASRVAMHAGYFARLDALHRDRAALPLTPEQRRLLERFHRDFVRAGARLGAAEQARHAQITERLATLSTRFAQNTLADEVGFGLVLSEEADCAGLPGFVRDAMRQAASERGLRDGLVVTLARAHIVPFLTFSERRDLREQAWRAWVTRGEHPGPHDNQPVALEILALRQEQARLHGYAHYADFALADSMAGSREAVEALLRRVWEPAQARFRREQQALEDLARTRGEPLPLEPWDWRFYAEKLRQADYDLDEARIKPYFPLERMVEAAFDCAQRLFGLRFVARPELALYHPDVRVYEVHDADDASLGLFLHDNHARSSKRSGAWMSSFQVQTRNTADGQAALPIVINNNNFAKGAPGAPTLLSHDDARTLFHEFGHGLHGLLSDVGYARIAGTNVLQDFVELPSQIFEHWLDEPEVLERHARHERSGEPLPAEAVERLHRARHFNQGYETLRYLASAWVDLAAHATGPDAVPDDLVGFERAELERLGAPALAGMNHRLSHFQHLFSGSDYAAGYYVYLWAEVLDADGYEAFVEAGDPFDAGTARRLRQHVYASGDSVDPAASYRAFRGRDASVEPMLRQRGLAGEPERDRLDPAR